MVERILAQQQPICATLLEIRKGDLMPSDDEFATMESFVKTMKPLVEITEVMGAEKWITISAVRPLLHKVLNTYLQPSSSDTTVEKAMKQAMLQNLSTRYTGEISSLPNTATFLDPCFKNLSFLSEDQQQEIFVNVELEAEDLLATTSSLSATSTESPPPKKSKGEQKLLSLLSDVISTDTDVMAGSNVKQEIARYTGDSQVQESPLDWWRINKLQYPTLAHLARKILSIPATSVPSERDFSHGGHIVNTKEHVYSLKM